MFPNKKTITVKDLETKKALVVDSSLYGPTLFDSTQEQESSEIIKVKYLNDDSICTVFNFEYPDIPTVDFQLDTWNSIEDFDQKAWYSNNIGIDSGFSCINKAFDGGLYPGFYLIAGESNIGDVVLPS